MPANGQTRRVQRLILWDIDGTLVSVGEIGAQVFDRAIERALGVRPTDRVRMSGKTDPQIVREYLQMLSIAHPEVHVPGILQHLQAELLAAEELVRAHGRVLPGVEEVLLLLGSEAGVIQTVLTGNIAPNALLKLASLDLDRLLDLEVGAFGSDHADRNELVPIARERVARLRGRSFASSDVWVVGDSENDLACARAGGVRCLLVGTGRTGLDDLRTLGADAVLADLGDTDSVIEILRS